MFTRDLSVRLISSSKYLIAYFFLFLEGRKSWLEVCIQKLVTQGGRSSKGV